MQIVRKKLTPDEIQPPGTRYDSGCDCVQVTPDGGTTWNDAPGLDPRKQPGFLHPPLGGDNRKCDAAANMVQAIRHFTETMDNGSTVWSLATLAFGLLGAFLPLGIIVDLVLITAEAIILVGIALQKAAMTDGVYDQLLCIFYENSDADGQLDDAAFAQVYSDIEAQLESTAAGFTERILDLIGRVGLNNMGAMGTETGDCDACSAWTRCWDVTNFDQWTVNIGTSSVTGIDGMPGNWPINVPPYNVNAYGTQADIEITFSTSITPKHINVHWEPNYTHDDGATAITVYWDGAIVAHQEAINNGDRTDTFDITATPGASTLRVVVDYGYSGSPYPPPDPIANIFGVQLLGDGDPPSEGDEC